jgi:hypothetical protein
MNFLLVSQSVIPRIEIFSRRPLACFAALLCATCFALVDCEGQTLSADPSGNRDIRERITSIFHETLKQGEITVEHNGRLVTARTFVPPSKEHVDQVRRYGNNAIPILAEYLTSGSGFEKYLALRFLGLIGGSGVVETLRKVALNDTSSSFRLVALLWLTETPWDLASPIIRQVANDDTSPEVRNKAKQILAQRERKK